MLGAFFEAILQGFRGEPAANLAELRADALAALRNNNQLLEASRNEPSGGPGWREGLGMLAQFGRSIFDALVARNLPSKTATKMIMRSSWSLRSESSQLISRPAFTTWEAASMSGVFMFHRLG